VKCPRCQHENPPQAKFCLECGARVALTCTKCRSELPAGAKFCLECGEPVASQATAQPQFTSPESYTPKHLAEKILTSKSALEGERKQVTVLFADLKGSMELLADRDPEEARKILDPVLELMMEAVHRYEGTVNQVMGDGIMALFGAPVAHEDHAVRACYAALRMQESAKKYAEEVRRSHAAVVKIRIGLNSGEVVVRAIGGDLHMDYTAVGQTTHLAGRMEQIADPGAIVITPDTLALAEGYVEVKSLGPVPVKGLTDAVEVYEVTGAGPVRTRLQAGARRGLTRFVGRDAEMGRLREAHENARRARGQVVALVGEPGVGKSRLVWEFAHSHRMDGWLVLESSSVSYGKATPYLPVIDLLKAYAQIDGRDDGRRVREKLTGKLLTLDRGLEPALPALLALLDVAVDDPQWEALDPPQRRRRILDAARRLLLRESQVQPLLLVFEDLHWIDAETQALLDALVDSLPTARLLLLVNYRPEYQHGWGSKTYYSQLRLDPLAPETAGELLQSLVGEDGSVTSLKGQLVERTEGNPFFLEESVRTLVETKVLVGVRGAYRLAKPLGEIQVPATVGAVLAGRIDRLPPEDKRLLQAASVVGKDLPFGLLQAVADLPEDELRRVLTRLQAAEFLYEASLFPELEYTFKHALTHEVTYRGLLQERRRALHGRLVEAFEGFGAERVTEHVEQLAHHAVRAELWDKAVIYTRQAGHKAASRSALREAVACLEQALAALAHLPEERKTLEQAIDLRLELRAVLFPLGELSRIVEALGDAARIADAIGDRRRLGRALALTGNYYYEIAQSDSSIEYADRALVIAQELGDPGLEASVRFLLGQNHYGVGNYARAIDVLAKTVAAAETQPSVTYLAGQTVSVSSRCFLARALVEIGEFRQAATQAEEAITLSETEAGAFGAAHGFFSLGLTHLRQGDLARAIAALERGLGVTRARTVSFLSPLLGCQLGYAQALSGRIQEGLSLLEEARHESKSTGRTGVVIWVQEMLAQVYLLCGRERDAAVTARDALDASRRVRRRGGEARILKVLADIAANGPAPDLDAAQRLNREALDLATELGMRPLVAHCHLGLGKLYRRTGQREQAQEHLTTATTMYREMGMTYWLEKAEIEQN
jgi:class 3 adenylate cyclase/tetratricopeptide (TPR) repeat protein